MVTKTYRNDVQIAGIQNWALWVYPVSTSDFNFLYILCSFWIALLSYWCSNSLLAEWEKRETSLEKSKGFHAKCWKSGKMVKQKKVWRIKKNTSAIIAGWEDEGGY